jgi:hypothetical protein
VIEKSTIVSYMSLICRRLLPTDVAALISLELIVRKIQIPASCK